MAAAASNATTSSMRLMPYHHTRGLLSTLRVFRGDDDDIRRVHVPLSVIVPYWSLLCGVSRSTVLFTVVALERDGSISLTKYDDATGSAEFWDQSDVVNDVADVLLEHGGLYSLIPRLVQVGDADADEERSESESVSVHDAEDSLVLGRGGEGGLGSSQHVSPQRFVNTATAELRKVKEEMSRLQASAMPVDGEPTEVFMFPREADIYRAAQRAHKAQQRRSSDASHPGDDRAPTPRNLNTSLTTLVPQGGAGAEEILAPPPDLLQRINDIDVGGVFVVLNHRQYLDAMEVESNGVAVSVASNVTFGIVHDTSAPVSAFAALQGQQQKEKLIFSSACTDQRLHEVVVDAYKTMLRRKDAPPAAVTVEEPWALGPQDNYYFRNIEHHVRQAAYRFDLSLSWRIALLMNMYPEKFEPVFGEPAELMDVGAPDHHADDDFTAARALSSLDREDATSLMGWLSSAPTRAVPPYYLAALQDGQGSPQSAAVTPSAAAGDDVMEDLIPFLAKRCPLVALAAAKGERSLLHANKKAAQQASERSSSARKSKLQSSSSNGQSVGGAAGAATSPYDEGFSVQIPTSPGAVSGLQSPQGRRVGSLSSQSSSTAFSGVTNTVAGGATHFSAEPFQKMLDGALTALSEFPDLVRACVEGKRVVDCELARFVLQTCVIDMTEGQVLGGCSGEVHQDKHVCSGGGESADDNGNTGAAFCDLPRGVD